VLLMTILLQKAYNSQEYHHSPLLLLAHVPYLYPSTSKVMSRICLIYLECELCYSTQKYSSFNDKQDLMHYNKFWKLPLHQKNCVHWAFFPCSPLKNLSNADIESTTGIILYFRLLSCSPSSTCSLILSFLNVSLKLKSLFTWFSMNRLW